MLHKVLKKIHKMKKRKNTSLDSFQRIGTIFEVKFVVAAKNRTSTPAEDFSLMWERP